MNCLILFSGTKSFEKVLESNGNKCYSVDIDNHFKPTFNVDILKWDYKKDLRDINIDYLHGSPICKEFTKMKNSHKEHLDLDLGMTLLGKTLEILIWLLHKNPNMKFTIENPKGKMRKLEIMKSFNRVTCSYCMYGYPYQKMTDIWYGNFDLKLKCCNRKEKKNGYPNGCNGMRDNKGIHQYRIGYDGLIKKDGVKKYISNQTTDCKYFVKLRATNPTYYRGYTDTYFRYRIPKSLIESIYEQIKPEPIPIKKDEIEEYLNMEELEIIDEEERFDEIDYEDSDSDF